MRRGEVWLADLEPSVGSEAAKVRPVLIVSNDGANAAASRYGEGVVTTVPLTTNVRRVRPYQAFLAAGTAGVERDSKVQCEQVRALDVTRLIRRLGAVPAESMLSVESALRLQLHL